jgi:glucose-1-phosphate thymidylyltransferase
MPEVRGLVVTTEGEPDAAALALCGGHAWTLPVANRPLLAHAVAGVRAAGARRTVLAGPRDHVVPGRGLTCVALEPGTGIAGALAAAAPALGGSAVLVQHGDGLLLGGALPGAPAALDAVLVVPERGPAVPERSPAFLAGPEAARIAAELPPMAGAAALLDALVAAGGELTIRTLPGAWRYSGRAESLLDANRLVLDALEHRVSDADLSTARIEGRVTVHPTAVVERATIRGPAIVGAGASIVDAFVGPYTAIGDGVVLEGAELENSIVFPGVRIRHVGPRIEASIIGADASIGRDFALPAALRLRVGRGAEVTLA